jgi:FkbM family methyltransferase
VGRLDGVRIDRLAFAGVAAPDRRVSETRGTQPLSAAAQLARFIRTHPAARGGRARAAGRLLSWRVAQWTGARRALVQVGRMRMYCYPGSSGASSVLYVGIPEWSEMNFALRYLRPGDTFLDVGANVGAWSLLLSTAIENLSVIAVEPSPIARTRLEENLALNALENVRVLAAALGAREGERTFTVDLDTENRFARPDETNAQALPVTTIDALIGEAPLALAKIDVEGYERDVLEGAVRVMARAEAPVLLFEYIDFVAAAAGVRFEDLSRLLAARGFRCMIFDPASPALRPFDPEDPARPHNVIAMRDVAAVERRLAAGAARALRAPIDVRVSIERGVGS